MSREIYRILQTVTDHLCGQTCVAMISGAEVSDVVASMGTKGRTNGRQLKEELQKRGIRTGKTKIINDQRSIPKFCVANIHFRFINEKTGRMKKPPGSGHFVVYWDGKKFDPLPDESQWLYPAQITSAFEIIDIE